jgi:glycosyltransferase involved in cell wall biosynthesis
MKLVFVIKTLGTPGGGAERVLTQVTSELAARGHELTIVSFGPDDEGDFYKVADRIDRLWLQAGDVKARSSPTDVLRRTLALRRLITGLAPDAAVGFMHSAYVPLALALWNSRIPVVASEHILYDHYRALPFEALALRLTARYYARITDISEAIRRSYPKRLSDRMDVIPNPVIPSEHLANSIGGSSKVLLNVGRLFEQKDQRTLIEAFARVAGVHPDWTLRILGEGPLRPMLEKLVKDRGLQDRVQLPGVVNEIAREYESAQIFVMSSRYESFGLATAEALAHGVPAIGFADCPGTNELIQDDVNGLLVPAGDRVAGLGAALDRLMRSPELRCSLGNAAVQSVARFSLDAIVSQWEALLGRIAKRADDKASHA